MAFTNYVNDPLDNYVTLDTFPNRYTNLSGTISVNGGIWVVGTGTLFLSEIGGGTDQIGTGTKVFGRCWLFNNDGTNPEIRRIQEVIDDTHLVLEKAFTVAPQNAVPHYVPPSRAMRGKFYAAAAGGKVNGVTLIVNETFDYGLTGSSDQVNISPLILDGTGGAIHTQAFYFSNQ